MSKPLKNEVLAAHGEFTLRSLRCFVDNVQQLLPPADALLALLALNAASLDATTVALLLRDAVLAEHDDATELSADVFCAAAARYSIALQR